MNKQQTTKTSVSKYCKIISKDTAHYQAVYNRIFKVGGIDLIKVRFIFSWDYRCIIVYLALIQEGLMPDNKNYKDAVNIYRRLLDNRADNMMAYKTYIDKDMGRYMWFDDFNVKVGRLQYVIGQYDNPQSFERVLIDIYADYLQFDKWIKWHKSRGSL